MDTIQEWIALAVLVLPLIGKMLTDWAANQKAAHDSALARIVGMAGRQAASIARELAKLPVTASPKSAEISLINGAVSEIAIEMVDSVGVAGADAERITAIVKGELDKILTFPVTAASIVPDAARGGGGQARTGGFPSMHS